MQSVSGRVLRVCKSWYLGLHVEVHAPQTYGTWHGGFVTDSMVPCCRTDGL